MNSRTVPVIVIVVAVLLLAPLPYVYASEHGGGPLWNERIASPSYGVNLAIFNLSYGDDGESNLILPGFELRHFNGVNAIEHGGFYFGYEVGAGLNFYTGSEAFEGSNGRPYAVESILAASVFLMGKHGYRWEPAGLPVGLGLELGLGVHGGGGFIDFRDIAEDDTEDQGEGGVGPLFEIGGELAVRTGDSHRITARISLAAGASVLTVSDDAEHSSGEMNPVRPGIRIGFVRDY